MSEQTESQRFFEAEIFSLLAQELWRRYYLKGEFGNTLSLSQFHEVASAPLRGLLGITAISWEKKKRLTIDELSRALKNSSVAWDLETFVTVVLKKELSIKSAVEEEVEVAFQVFLSELAVCDDVFHQLLTRTELQWWFKTTQGDLTDFQKVSLALQNLPQTFTRMPVFAYQQTGDAHSFDDGRSAGRLLLQLLAKLSKAPKDFPQELAATEEKNLLLTEFFLLRDDILNFVTIHGLIAKNSGQVNEMWQQGAKTNCSWNVPLKEVLRMEEILPNSGNKVLIVENSGVYSILVDLFPELAIICSSGQFSYAVWQLLRKLAASGTYLYYSGDLDPEGLLMAQRLIEMFPEKVEHLCMETSSFQQASVLAEISEPRLKQLKKLKEPELQLVGELIRKTGRVAYQEGLLANLILVISSKFEQ